VAYICFKLNCPCRGVITSKGSGKVGLDQTSIRHKKLFDGKLSALTSYEAAYLQATFGIESRWLDAVRFSEEDMRVYYPQYDLMGRVHGYIARYYPKLASNRPCKGAKAYWKPVIPTDIGLCFPNMEVLQQVVESKTVCVVEDYPSMLRINSQIGVTTCCLGGTAIYDRHVSTMLALDVKKLIIVLDADAITKAVKLKRSLSLAFDEVIIIPLLGVDCKDMTVGELNKTFEVIA
jgi:hypothetical protein